MSIKDVDDENMDAVATSAEELIGKLKKQRASLQQRITALEVNVATPPDIVEEAVATKKIMIAEFKKLIKAIGSQIENLHGTAVNLKAGAAELRRSQDNGATRAKNVDPNNPDPGPKDDPNPNPQTPAKRNNVGNNGDLSA